MHPELTTVYRSSDRTLVRAIDEAKLILHYEVLKGNIDYHYTLQDGVPKSLPIKAFWVKITVEEYEGAKLNKYTIENYGPLSSRMGKVKILCDNLSRQKVVPSDADAFISGYIIKSRKAATSHLKYLELSSDGWHEDFAATLESELEGKTKFRNSVILSHHRRNVRDV